MLNGSWGFDFEFDVFRFDKIVRFCFWFLCIGFDMKCFLILRIKLKLDLLGVFEVDELFCLRNFFEKGLYMKYYFWW